MQGSTHSLRQMIRTRRTKRRRIAAARIPLRRIHSHAGEIALIHQQFAHRFFLAMQEVCMATRSAIVQRLTHEKAAALARVRLMRAADADGDKCRRDLSRSLQNGYRAANRQCCLREALEPVRSRRHATRKKQERVNDCN